jgi:hypothetical protein
MPAKTLGRATESVVNMPRPQSRSQPREHAGGHCQAGADHGSGHIRSADYLQPTSLGEGRVAQPGSGRKWTVCCIGPEVHLHDLLGLGPGSRDARSAGAPDCVLHALARGDVDAVVIAAHGRPMPGLGHYLELGSGVILTPPRCSTQLHPNRWPSWPAGVPGFLARAAATR